MGTPVKVAQALPSGWFRVGSRDVRKKATHSALKQRHGDAYVSGYDEGPVGALCLKLKVGYVEVTTSDFGSGVQYSVLAPKCARCSLSSGTEEEFASGTGLRLGLTRAKTSEFLKTMIVADLTDITFEETRTVRGARVLHTEVLSLEFKEDRLVSTHNTLQSSGPARKSGQAAHFHVMPPKFDRAFIIEYTYIQ